MLHVFVFSYSVVVLWKGRVSLYRVSFILQNNFFPLFLKARLKALGKISMVVPCVCKRVNQQIQSKHEDVGKENLGSVRLSSCRDGKYNKGSFSSSQFCAASNSSTSSTNSFLSLSRAARLQTALFFSFP